MLSVTHSRLLVLLLSASLGTRISPSDSDSRTVTSSARLRFGTCLRELQGQAREPPKVGLRSRARQVVLLRSQSLLAPLQLTTVAQHDERLPAQPLDRALPELSRQRANLAQRAAAAYPAPGSTGAVRPRACVAPALPTSSNGRALAARGPRRPRRPRPSNGINRL